MKSTKPLLVGLTLFCQACGPAQHGAPEPGPAEFPIGHDAKATELADELGLWLPSQHEVEELLESREAFFVAVTTDGCGACGPALLALDGALEAHPDARLVVLDNFDVDWLNANLTGVVGWPSVGFVQRGAVLDWYIGGFTTDRAARFVARNLGVPEACEPTPLEGELEAQRRAVAMGAGVCADLSGLDLRDISLFAANLSGSLLRETDLRGASLNGVVFARSDLSGANLEGAELGGVVWGSCVCPDGTRSDDHGLTCDGHLNATVTYTEKGRNRALAEQCRAAYRPLLRDLSDEQRFARKAEMSVACNYTQRTGVVFGTDWRTLTFDEAAPLLDTSQGEADLYADRPCSFRYVAALPGQRDAIEGVMSILCEDLQHPHAAYIGVRTTQAAGTGSP